MDFVLFSRNSQVCRACLDQTSETTHFLGLDELECDTEEFTIGQKLSECIPQLDLRVTPNAAICTKCLSAINFIIKFKKVCLENEENIKNYVRKIGSLHADLVDLIQEREHIKRHPEEIYIKDEPLDDALYDNTSKLNEKKREEKDYLEEVGSSHADLHDLAHKNEQFEKDFEEINVKNEPLNNTLYSHTANLNENEQEEKSCKTIESENEEKLAEVESALNLQSLSSCTDDGENSVFICNECGEHTVSKAKLIIHLKKHEKQSKMQVIASTGDGKCGKSSLNKRNMQERTRETRLKCSICGYIARKQSLLVIHMRSHTGEKPYTCTECPYKCARSYNLKQHMRGHTGETPYKCNLCDYKSTKSSSLVVHMRNHSGEKPFKCADCPYKSTTRSNLKKHIRIHTGETPYECTQCDYKSAQKSGLIFHMRTHTDQKPYNCTECLYKSTRADHLKQHMRVHTGETPYKCELCDYKSAQRSALIYHMSTHTGQKPYECNECPFQCARAHTLKQHMRVHTGKIAVNLKK